MSDPHETMEEAAASGLIEASPAATVQLDGYWLLQHDDSTVILWRSDKRPDDMPAFLASFDGIFTALAGRDADSFALLIDLRAAVGRNDPEFEAGLQQRRHELFERFKQTAVVVETAVGSLQVHRHIVQDGYGHKVRVFSDPDQARRWLQGGDAVTNSIPRGRPAPPR
ncbi:MAG: hypothetical protein ACE37F_02835 [Nannocystaceae bacterium]|nr:hypothetical protein [bacterium]